MKFEVTRTRSFSGTKPCDEAFESEFVVRYRRTFKTPEDFDKRFASTVGPWFSEGTNHGTWQEGKESGICRDVGTRMGYAVEINSLEELMAFIKKYGEVVLNEDEIEIYDGFRE